jgi:integrase
LPTKKLTDLFVERVKPPPKGRVEYFDAAFGGLALRITEKGHKSWSLHYRLHGRLRRYTFGSYPAIKPVQARREAQRALDRVREGIDPSEEKRVARKREIPLGSSADYVATAVADYLDRLERNTAKSTFREAKRILERDVVPEWRNRPIASITRGDVNRLVDAIIARGAEVHANRVLARIRAFFNWTVERGRLSASPVAGMKPPTKEHPRDRVLTDDELRWLWRACDELEWPFGPLIKLLLLTVQRRDEVAGMEWSEVDLQKATWTQPGEKVKNNRVHEVHLSAAALEVLKSIPHVSDSLIFTSTGSTPVSGFSRAKLRLDTEMQKAKREELGKKAEAIADWILHDLRRTAATGMARLNFPPHVVDKVLNHTSGTIRGVAAVYNRFEYLDDRRTALDAWGRHVTNLISPARADIIPISKRSILT